MKEYEVWLEGYAITGNHGRAHYFGKYVATTFEDACEVALQENKWEMKEYNKERNAFWGCRFFDNESQARASFG